MKSFLNRLESFIDENVSTTSKSIVNVFSEIAQDIILQMDEKDINKVNVVKIVRSIEKQMLKVIEERKG